MDENESTRFSPTDNIISSKTFTDKDFTDQQKTNSMELNDHTSSEMKMNGAVNNDEETLQLKKQLISDRQRYEEEIHFLKVRIEELEDWNEDSKKSSENCSSIELSDNFILKSNLETLTVRNRQLELDLQRFQTQQKNNQLALERLDEYEETIGQLQEELEQFRSARKKSPNNENLLEEIRLKLKEAEENHREEQNELRRQLELKENELQTIQRSTMTPGAPPSVTSTSDWRDEEFEKIFKKFSSLLPGENFWLDENCSLIDRFSHLFEQFSSYIGTLAIMQEEFESLKQILVEKQDEYEKMTNRKSIDFENDDEEEIFPRQSITPGEKQQLIAQNEILSSLLNEKEEELISFQQSEKVREETWKNQLNDIRNILDEKLRENSSLKKEKIFFIEKISQLEREREEKIPSNGEKIDEDLEEKYQRLKVDFELIQSLIQQKNEAFLQCQNELNQFQNLFYHQKKKSEEFDRFQSNFLEKEKKFQIDFQLIEQMKLELKRITHERDLAIVEKKQQELILQENSNFIERLNEEIRIEKDQINSNRVEKQLVKNILLSFFQTPVDKQLEVIPILGALVDFTPDEYRKAIENISNQQQQINSSGWLTSWLGNNSPKTKQSNSNQSFTELLIQYVDQQSTKDEEKSTSETFSPSTTTNI